MRASVSFKEGWHLQLFGLWEEHFVSGEPLLTRALLSTDLSDNTLSYTKNEAASSPNITPGEFSGGCGSPDVVNKEVIPMSHANSWWLTLPQVYNLSACVLSIKTRALPGSSSFYVWCCLFCESGWYEGFVFASRLHIMLLFVLRSQWFGQLNVSLIEVAGFQLIKYHIFLFSHSFYM